MAALSSLRHGIVFVLLTVLGTGTFSALSAEVVPGLEVIPGAVNGAVIQRGDKTLVIYGDPTGKLSEADTVLFTHHRRDVVWAGRALVERGAKAVVPAKEVDQFAEVQQFWVRFKQARFHD